MNTERLTRLRDAVLTMPPEHFNMGIWCAKGSHDNDEDIRGPVNLDRLVNTCGTVMCMGGLAEAMFSSQITDVYQDAGELLGLDDEVAHELFYPYAANRDDWATITQEEAAETLTKLINTGAVDWSHVEPIREAA